jgi:hypothetical protein
MARSMRVGVARGGRSEGAEPSQRSIVLVKLALQAGRRSGSDGRRKRLRRGRGEERKAFAVGPATTSETANLRVRGPGAGAKTRERRQAGQSPM